MGWMTYRDNYTMYETDLMSLSNFSEYTVEVEAFIYHLPLDFILYVRGKFSERLFYSSEEI